MRILILRGGALGDFIVTLPALRALRAKWPDAHIELVGNATAAALAVQNGLLDAAHSQHSARWMPLHGDPPLPGELHDWLNSFDVVANFWPDPDESLSRHLRGIRGEHVSGSAHPVSSPAAKHFCDALLPLGVHADSYESTLPITPRAEARAAELLAGAADFAAIHPGSGSPAKTWPFDRWCELVQALGDETIAVTGAADHRLPAWPGSVVLHRHFHELPLPVLAAVLAKATLYVGHDTGVTHLAAAVGTPVIALFGPTDPALWAPPGVRVRVVKRGATMEAIAVKHTLAAATALHRSATFATSSG